MVGHKPARLTPHFIILLPLLLIGCRATVTPVRQPAFKLIPFEAVTQEVLFTAKDDTPLAGQFDWPPGQQRPALVFIIHHSDAVDRDSYQYLAARLVPAGYGVFRFDKRGTGLSEGVYGCCEADDALAAYQAALAQGEFDKARVFIVAQSIGSRILAEKFYQFERVHRPTGVILLSNLLENEEILSIKAPLHIIISDSESELAALGQNAVQTHRAAYDYGASFYVAPQTEHTLFDISDSPIDWTDPDWPDRFHSGAWLSLYSWLENH
jgi:alpha/beta superfamily hydrolase